MVWIKEQNDLKHQDKCREKHMLAILFQQWKREVSSFGTLKRGIGTKLVKAPDIQLMDRREGKI